MAHVDLCSGIGGFALGFEWAELSKPVLFCDIEPWSRQILAKHWPDVPIADDVKELANDPTRIIHAIGDRPSILTAGYPCQPFSQAGQRRGSEDDRHIWPEIFAIVQQVRPDWIVCENVSGHITMGLNEVLSDLADKANYAVQTFHLGAVSVDAPHRRMRLWIVARNVGNTKHDGSPTPTVKGSIGKASKHNAQGQSKTKQSQGASEPRDSGSVGEIARITNVADTQSVYSNGSGEHTQQSPRQVSELGERSSEINVADANSERRRSWNNQRKDAKEVRQSSRHPGNNSRRMEAWKPEPSVGRVAHGIPRRVDRLKGLGNAIVPQIAMRIGQTIKAVQDA